MFLEDLEWKGLKFECVSHGANHNSDRASKEADKVHWIFLHARHINALIARCIKDALRWLSRDISGTLTRGASCMVTAVNTSGHVIRVNQVAYILRVRKSRPWFSWTKPESIVRLYLDAMPEEIYIGSCLDVFNCLLSSMLSPYAKKCKYLGKI